MKNSIFSRIVSSTSKIYGKMIRIKNKSLVKQYFKGRAEKIINWNPTGFYVNPNFDSILVKYTLLYLIKYLRIAKLELYDFPPPPDILL